jgi:nucleotide-binding universal stress UspA family protein
VTAGEILVGVDGSANGAAALRWALAEAGLRGTTVTALHAWGHAPPGRAGGGHTFDAAYGAGDADAALTAAIAAAAGPEAVAAVTRRVVCSPPAKALLAAARGADLLVVGTRGVGGFRGLLLGSVSSQCLHHATGPLAVVRSGTADGEDAGRLVVGVDGSDSSARALGWALAEGRLRRARVDVVHAWLPPYVMPAPYAGMPLDLEAAEKAAGELVDRLLDREDLARQPALVERIAVRGTPARAILETALGADLVVLGTRGRGGFAGLLLGSVTHHVAHHASCPLVVVP